MNDRDKKLYELARKQGDRRFGSACSHTYVVKGVCQNCLRRIWPK